MTEQTNDDNLDMDIINRCRENGFDENQTNSIIKICEALIVPIIERYEKEISYAGALLNQNDPQAEIMVMISSINYTIGQIHINRCITFNRSFDVSYINPTDYISSYPHGKCILPLLLAGGVFGMIYTKNIQFS